MRVECPLCHTAETSVKREPYQAFAFIVEILLILGILHFLPTG